MSPFSRPSFIALLIALAFDHAAVDAAAGRGANSSCGIDSPRNRCSPSDRIGFPYTRAKSSLTTIGRFSVFATASTRLTRLTAGPMTVKSSRSAAPILRRAQKISGYWVLRTRYARSELFSP